MKKIFLLLFCTLTSIIGKAQTEKIYSKTYGKSENPTIIFIHGGPRGNSTLFEGTTAENLAGKGFYVIVYDRRGEGRSIDTTATFTFQEAISDLNSIYEKYNIKRANIIAHSFGGLVGTLFTEQNPEKVSSLILAGALFSQQETYNHILETTRKIYKKKNDTLMLSKISEIERLAKNSAEYRKQCYEIASMNNYFKMPFPTNEANQLRENYENSEYGKSNIRNDDAPILFYKNENKNNIDTKPILKKLEKENVKLFAIYGLQDKIFSEKQLSDMKKIVGKQNFKTIDNCSHYPFVDQQNPFIEIIEKWIK
ncbi:MULTISPECIES: alpha/beta hydrolase [Sphingobacterium]|uniref:Proline iminopeptidase n=2 Tax=Sphingobacterium siyangense TaxID=459529 RepID=A0A562MZA8_9SPHI|nr:MULTISPECIES: alpha/beta hydrolase [Sphingobacterium]TWI25186.1 proline iminopeptidase [Sphingobacterium siyangense]UQA73431.1 alpha/beta hydrolase [Sphingobacterium siyangense]